jgi:hypothetical protein
MLCLGNVAVVEQTTRVSDYRSMSRECRWIELVTELAGPNFGGA